MKNSNQNWSSASYLNQTHVNCFLVCYATTTSKMLRNSHMEKGEHQGCIFFCNKSHCRLSVSVKASASYGNRTHVNILEGYCATTTPTMLVNADLDGRKHFGLKPFLRQFFGKILIRLVLLCGTGLKPLSKA